VKAHKKQRPTVHHDHATDEVVRKWFEHLPETNDANVAWRLLIACTHNTTRRIDELIIGGNGMLVKNVECVDGSTIPKKGDAAACGA